MLRLSNVPLQFALSDSLWLSLAHSGSLWLTLALSGAHRLTRFLLGSPRHGRVATVFPSLLYDHVVHCCTMSLTSSDAEIQDDGRPMDIGQEKDHLIYQQYGSPELLPGSICGVGRGRGGILDVNHANHIFLLKALRPERLSSPFPKCARHN